MTQTAHSQNRQKIPEWWHVRMWQALLTSSSISPLNSFAQFVETRLRSVFQFRWFPSWWILCVCWSWNVWQPQGLGELWLSQAMKVRRITWLAKQEAPTSAMVTGNTLEMEIVARPSGPNAPKEAPTFALAPGSTLATTSAVWPLINKYGSLKWRAVPTFVMVTGRTSAITNVSRPKRPPAPKAAPTFALAPGPTLATTSAAWPQIGSKLKSCPRLQWTQCDTRKALPLVTSLDCVCPWTLCAICWIEFRWFPSWWLLCVCMCLLVTDWITLGWE